MANYTPIFEKPYPNGYEDLPSETTPVTAETLNDKDDAIVNIESYLEENPIGEGGASALSDLTDVDVSTVDDGQILKYNAETEKWENADGGGGGSANVWEGSHAEYEEEKAQIADETTLLFNDDIGLESESDYYSEVEQVIGTYLGKPLYRKVLTGNITPSSGTYSIVVGTLSELGADFITKISGFIQNTEQGILYKMAIPSYVDSTNASGVYVSGTGDIRLYITGTYHKYSLVLEYTKTTDSVVGVVGGIKKGDNYSTNEQVFGTWIDGKPLYRKTIDLGNMGNPVSKSVDVSALNIKVCAKMYGEIHHNTQSTYNFRPLPMVDNTALSNNVRIDITNNNLRVISSGDWASYNGTVTLEYTKTTD